MSRLLRILLLLAAALLVGVSGYKLYGIYCEYAAGKTLYGDVAGQVVKSHSSSSVTEGGTESEKAPVSIDFDALLQNNEDIVAWIYSEDTKINYPVVQAEDNDYYLRRLLDGSYNIAGTIFMDCGNRPDFSDLNTLIYGHNMKNDTMFGSLSRYKEQSYYDSHPVLWLLTRDKSYRVELLAGYTTSSDGEDYTLYTDSAAFSDYLTRAVQKSDFQTEVELSSVERVAVFSTCSYEYDQARYVLIGSLVSIENS